MIYEKDNKSYKYFIIGLILGILAKLFDIYFYVQHFRMSLSDIFSDMAIYILIGVIISLYSKNKRYAMLNIFLFCIGLLFTYYGIAKITHSVYGVSFIKFWTVFAFISPFLAYLVVKTKEKGLLASFIKIGIIVLYIIISIFESVDILHIVILFLLFILLFKRYKGEENEKV